MTVDRPGDTRTSRDAVALARAFEARMAQGIQLYAGSCLLSPRVHHALANTLGLMPAMGDPHHKQQPGTTEISELEQLVSGQLNDLFGSAWSDARLQSCTYANAAVYAAFSAPGELVASVAAEDGGHASHQAQGTLGVLGRRQLPLVFRDGLYDDEASAREIAQHAPRIVILGASVMLDPYTTSSTVAAARACGALLVYDASHVAGLVAAGLYQNPLDLGFDIMTTSTYKTLSAPPGGLLLGRDPAHHARLKQHLVGGWTSNYDAGRLVGISVALDEAKRYMRAYMGQVLDHAAYLRQALLARDVPCISSAQPGRVDQTSHQLVLLAQAPAQAEQMFRATEAAGIYTGLARVPGQPQAGGVRLGTQVVTRQGITTAGLDALADCLQALWAGQPAASVAGRVQTLAAGLDQCLYCDPA